MKKHALERTNKKGEDFIGKCWLCGKENLKGSDILIDECPNGNTDDIGFLSPGPHGTFIEEEELK